MLLVKRINETKHREPFAMSKVVVSLVRLRVLVLLFFFFFCDDSLPSSNVTANGQRRRHLDSCFHNFLGIGLATRACRRRCRSRLSGPKHWPVEPSALSKEISQ